MDTPLKRCTLCGLEKPITQFSILTKTGKPLSRCKACAKAIMAAKRKGLTSPRRAPEPMFRTCNTCHELKPITEFAPSTHGHYKPICHACTFPPLPDGKTEHTCTQCGQTKPVEEFNRNKRGLPKSWCKACSRTKMEAWHATHPYEPKPPRPQPTEKRCNHCGEVKPISEFTYLVGYRRYVPYCRECSRIRSNAAYWANRTIRLAKDAVRRVRNRDKIAQWRRDNRHILRDCDARRRARKKNAPRVEKIDRAAIIARDNGTCYICKCQPVGDDLTLDHVIPLVRGGSHTADNLRVCCRSCNSHKRHRLLSEIDPTEWLPS